MDHTIPSAADVRERMQQLRRADMAQLADKTGVPFTTLLKIKTGETADPRIETVRAIWPALIDIQVVSASGVEAA